MNEQRIDWDRRIGLPDEITLNENSITMDKADFQPRKFICLVDEFGLDDGGVASFTFKVQSLKKGKVYKESNPVCIQGHQRGVIIDDNSCWHHVGTPSFKEIFKEIE